MGQIKKNTLPTRIEYDYACPSPIFYSMIFYSFAGTEGNSTIELRVPQKITKTIDVLAIDATSEPSLKRGEI